jgi:hypothetical protein
VLACDSEIILLEKKIKNEKERGVKLPFTFCEGI